MPSFRVETPWSEMWTILASRELSDGTVLLANLERMLWLDSDGGVLGGAFFDQGLGGLDAPRIAIDTLGSVFISGAGLGSSELYLMKFDGRTGPPLREAHEGPRRGLREALAGDGERRDRGRCRARRPPPAEDPACRPGGRPRPGAQPRRDAGPRVAKAEPAVAGLVILAGTSRPLEDVIADQLEYLGGLKGGGESVAEMKKQAAALRTVTAETSGLVFGAPAAYWLDLRGYKPAELARKLPQRILVLQGERDYQVTMKDFEGWKAALAGRRDVTFKTYPKLNHLFLEGEGKSTPAEYEKAGHVAAAVLDDIAAFVRKKG